MTLQRLPALLLAAAAACGGGSSSPEQSFRDATPAATALSMQVDGAPATTATATATGTTTTPMMTVLDSTDPCHPHLFVRTEALAARLNRHVAKALDRIEHAIARTPALSTGTEVQWDEVRGAVEVRFTMTRSGDVYTWSLDLRPAGGTDAQWATVLSGNIDRTGATGPHQGSGAFTVDLDALHRVIPTETAGGKLDATFAIAATKRVIDVTAAGVVWDPDSDGDGLGHVSPLNASYHYVREPGVGGSLAMTDSMVFLCPTNPSLVPADVTLASRWYVASDGAVHGRGDAKAAGGPLAAGDTIVGVTCHQASTGGTAAEGYWMMKLEDSTGATVQSWTARGSPAACDPAFGPVPAATAPTSDFDFSAPVTFPGEF